MALPDWLNGVIVENSLHDGGNMLGGPPRVVWHTYEAGYSLPAYQGARRLIADGNEVHFVFHPISGELVQILPARRAGRGLRNDPGGVETNRQGSVCLQVEVIAQAAHPWTDDLTNRAAVRLHRLLQFFRLHGVPDVWPAGSPPVSPGPGGMRSAVIWQSHAGHYGHSQVPENDHTDPGALDVNVIFGRELEDPMPIYVRPDPAGEPGDGLLAVAPTGVHAVTAAEWNILKTDPSVTVLGLPRAEWAQLRTLADAQLVRATDLRRLAAEIISQLPDGGAGATAEHIADVLARRLAT